MKAKTMGSGWHGQTLRHSNARRLGRAGGSYADRLYSVKGFQNLVVTKDETPPEFKKSGLVYVKVIAEDKDAVGQKKVFGDKFYERRNNLKLLSTEEAMKKTILKRDSAGDFGEQTKSNSKEYLSKFNKTQSGQLEKWEYSKIGYGFNKKRFGEISIVKFPSTKKFGEVAYGITSSAYETKKIGLSNDDNALEQDFRNRTFMRTTYAGARKKAEQEAKIIIDLIENK